MRAPKMRVVESLGGLPMTPKPKPNRRTHTCPEHGPEPCANGYGLEGWWDKPTYLYRPRVKDGTAFDALCTDFPESWRKLVDAVLWEMGL